MKRTILLLTIIVFALGLGFTEARCQDAVLLEGAWSHTDSLITAGAPSVNGSSRDTVDISFTNASNFGFYEVDAYSTSADTLNIQALSGDGKTFCSRAVIDLSVAALITSRTATAITGTTMKQWIIVGGVGVATLRFYGTGANSIRFVVMGRRGMPVY